MKKLKGENKLVFNYSEKENTWSVRFKGYLYDQNGDERSGKPTSLILGKYTQEGTKDFEDFFPREVFPFPKPVSFIKQLISVTVTPEVSGENICLDIFAGSGTTAHAILDMNVLTTRS